MHLAASTLLRGRQRHSNAYELRLLPLRGEIIILKLTLIRFYQFARGGTPDVIGVHLAHLVRNIIISPSQFAANIMRIRTLPQLLPENNMCDGVEYHVGLGPTIMPWKGMVLPLH